MKKLPIVALIGLTNAGKSSLLNRLAHKSIAITAREAGTTRDNVVATIDGKFKLIDTAGLKDPEDDFEASIQDQIQDAIELADAIVLAVDSAQYPGQEESMIAKLAHKSSKPIILSLNKSDLGAALPEYEFARLGIKNIVRTSATTGQGAKDLKAMIMEAVELSTKDTPQARPRTSDEPHNDGREERVSERTDSTASTIKLALIGRPNVGKSSLFNVLAQKQQAIVANLSGTTRDVNRTAVKYHGIEIELLDTAGIRRPGKREVGIEKFSALRTFAAIEEADICALLVDATDPHAKLDQTLAGQIIDAGKGIMIVLTKTDLLTDDDLEPGDTRTPTDKVLDGLERDFNFIPYAPAVITSAITGQNVTTIFDLALAINKERETTLRTADLNKVLGDALLNHPPAAVKGATPKPKYIVQTDTAPPWFVIHGKNLKLLHFSYERYLENKIREFHPFNGTPIKISIREAADRHKPAPVTQD